MRSIGGVHRQAEAGSSRRGLHEDRPVRDVCHEHQMQEGPYHQRHEQLLEAGAERFAGREEPASEKAKEKRIAELKLSWAARPRSWRSREALRAGSEGARCPVTEAGRGGVSHPQPWRRVMQISRQATYAPRGNTGRHQEAGHRRRRCGDHRGRQGQPDRRLPACQPVANADLQVGKRSRNPSPFPAK